MRFNGSVAGNVSYWFRRLLEKQLVENASGRVVGRLEGRVCRWACFVFAWLVGLTDAFGGVLVGWSGSGGAWIGLTGYL
jgi:hypothetical protein